MKINKLLAEEVYKYLNFNISFNTNLNFLIGINGSGKTTVLRIIMGLLSPNFDFLNQISFKRLELICSTSKNEKNIKIIAETLNDDKVKISLIVKGKKNEEGIFIRYPIANFLKYETSEEYEDKIWNYRNDFDSLEVNRLIQLMSTPVFLGLDRRIIENKPLLRRRYISHSRKYSRERVSFEESINNSLVEVQDLIYDYIRRIPSRQSRLVEEFKNKIFAESFRFNEDVSLKVRSEEDLEKKKNEIQQAIEKLNVGNITNEVNTFFANIKELRKDISIRTPDFPSIIKWSSNAPQLKRIDSIIELSKDYQIEIMKLNEPLSKFVQISSDFLRESGKSLELSNDGEIQILFTKTDKGNIFQLSSGEKQIIIMIAHLIFYESQMTSGVYIIDEPELSLHLGWQELFVNSIMDASPNTQFILATHSPAIVAEFKNSRFCKDLSKYARRRK